MKNVRQKNTQAEITLRKKLYHNGIRYRIHYKSLIGTPDIVITTSKLIIFVDGEFWHGKNWKLQKQKLKTNKSFWIAKIERNIQRDMEINIALTKLGWIVLRFWDKEILKNPEKCVEMIESCIRNCCQSSCSN